MYQFYRLLSWFFHPIITLALMLFLAIVFSFTEGQPLILWLGVGFGMIYGIPGVYYFILLYQKKIDVDVKNLIQRENLFKISIITLAAVFVLTIIFTEAEILQKMLLAATQGYSFPILTEVDLGHTRPMLTLPIGIQARINLNGTIELLERSTV